MKNNNYTLAMHKSADRYAIPKTRRTLCKHITWTKWPKWHKLRRKKQWFTVIICRVSRTILPYILLHFFCEVLFAFLGGSVMPWWIQSCRGIEEFQKSEKTLLNEAANLKELWLLVCLFDWCCACSIGWHQRFTLWKLRFQTVDLRHIDFCVMQFTVGHRTA